MRDLPFDFPGASGGYTLKAGHATFHYSGGNILGHAVCDMRGSASVDIFQAGGGGMSVFSVDQSKPFAQGPHDYSGGAAQGFGPMVTLTMKRSPDGVHYNGSYSVSASGISSEWSWTMTGEKVRP